MRKSVEILNKYWGFEKFRPLQEEIVDSIIYGHDTLAILPTGGGKSICFQVPGMALNGLTIVISPLIALMEDQVTSLESKGIKARLITSAMSYREIDITLDNARFGNTSFLYSSPERLKSPLFIERCKDMDVRLIVVDEAHCISEWGHDFRPSYREIKSFRELHPKAPLIALTASATKKVQKDIIAQLCLKDVNVFTGNLERNNLSYQVQPSTNKTKSILDFCISHPNETGIVYCQTRRSVKNIVTQLRAANVSAGFYHGGLKPDDKKYMLENWMSGKIKVMVATNAFGMGIDKPNVRYVLHFEVPSSLEAYYQEAGRAGRDELESLVIAYWEMKDIELMKERLVQKYPPADRIKNIYESVCNYLKIAIGAGDQETYDFNLIDFHNTFNLSYTETYYSLKILQLNNTISFVENSFHPTRLKFAVGSSALYKFQVAHDSINPLVTILTRSYPGIFDRFININEDEICKRLKISKSQFSEQLKYLEKYGLIDVNFKSSFPKITFLHERLPSGHLSLNKEIYLERKKIEEHKLESVIDYLTDNSCRSKMISNYFDSNSPKCGKCDVCRSEASQNHSFNELLDIIPTLLPLSLDALSNQLTIDRNMCQKALHHLMLEEKIIFVDGEFTAINS